MKKKQEVARFCSQLKMLLSSGVPLLESLRIVRDMSRDKKIEKIIERISEGESLAAAMQSQFPPMVVSSIEGAEKAGNLEEVLDKLAIHYEERAEVENRIKSALIYPCFVTILCLLSMLVLFLFVLPGFKTLFSDLGTELPLFSRIFIGIGDFLSRFWYVLFLIVLGAGTLLSRYRKTEQGALTLDKMFLQLKFFSYEQISNTFRTLGSLLEGGVAIVEALNTTIKSCKNKAFQKIIFEIKENVLNGERLSDSFSRHGLFPNEAIQMLAVGEGSGKLAEMLLGISNFYERERETFIKRFTTMLEPTLTLAVGLMVGIIAVAMFLPMMNMISTLQ